jgi:viologen exporter family transport system permease protein
VADRTQPTGWFAAPCQAADGLRLAFGHYRLLVAVALRCAWQYRLSLALLTAAELTATALDLAAVGIVFANIDALDGFSLAQAALVYGTAALSFALAEAALGQVDRLGWAVRDGRIDGLLVRPVSLLVQTATAEFSPQRLGRIVQPAVVVGVALAAVDLDWTPLKVVAVPVTVLCGSVVAGSIAVAGAAVLFVAPDAGLATSAVNTGAGLASQYPMALYGRHVLILLTFVVPVAFVNWQPMLYLLDRPDPFGLPHVLRYCSLPVALLAAGAASLAWRAGVRHYRSTGS